MIKANKLASNYHRFDIPMEASGEKWMFTCSDVHFDNPKCNRELFFKHMDKALELDAMITITGDFFCLMNGNYDPRRSKSKVLPEHNDDNYLDLVINDAAEKLIPYAKNIILISRGNHETSVSKRNETDVMERFVERLNLLAGSKIQIGNYLGYYTLNFNYQLNGGNKRPINIAYSHGHWGGIVTKGALSVMRYAAMFPDADIVFSGHCFDDQTEILTKDGWISHDELTIDTEVATMNLDTEAMEFNKVNSIHKYDDYKELYHIEAEGLDLMTTDEHGLVYKKRGKEGYHKCKTIDFIDKKRIAIPNACHSYKSEEVEFDLKLLPIASWIVADGSIDGKAIRFHFKKQRKIDRVKQLLTDANIPFSSYVQSSGNTKIRIGVEDSQRLLKELDIENKHFSNKYYLINDEACKIILNEYMLSDGNKAKNYNSYVLYSNNIEDLSVLQSMCAKIGLKSTLRDENEKRRVSRLNVTTKDSTYFANGRYEKVPYSGTVWCVNVDNGTLVVRRNGRVMITQNTHDSFIMTQPRYRMRDKRGKVEVEKQWHVKTGTYKEEFEEGKGWAAEKIGVPKHLGGAFTKFYYVSGKQTTFEITLTH